MKLTFREKLQFMAALLVAALFGWRHPRQAVKRVGKAFGLWMGLVGRKDKYVSDELAARRLAVCKCCPLWYEPFGTCGSPLYETSEGCFCYMRAKTQLAAAQCWQDESLDEPMESSWTNQGLPSTHIET